MKDAFSQIVKEHARRYPKMEILDYGKLAFQSEYGPGHFIAERQTALDFLQEEMAELPFDTVPESTEPIGGGLCRFPLSFCKSEAEISILAKLFFLTAGEHRGFTEGIKSKASELKKLRIPGMAEWLEDWEKKGYPPVSHSQSFWEAYHPHYRVIKREYAGFFPAAVAVERLMEAGETVLICIDGRCGSGKTSLAGLFGRLFDCNIFHMDDFYLPAAKRPGNFREIPGGNMDFNRILDEICDPVQKSKPVIYRPYDCRKGQITDMVRMEPKLLNILEGSYSHHPALSKACRYKIFLTCSKEEQKNRLQKREGDYYSAFEKQWIPLEEHYYQCCAVEQKSDLIMDTSEFFTL